MNKYFICLNTLINNLNKFLIGVDKILQLSNPTMNIRKTKKLQMMKEMRRNNLGCEVKQKISFIRPSASSLKSGDWLGQFLMEQNGILLIK